MGFVCVVGSVNLDTFVRLERLPEIGETILGQPLGTRPGGKGFNQAVAAMRCGARTRFCTQIGDDLQGEILRRGIDNAGLESRLHVSSGATSGSAFIAILAGSANSIIVAPGANAKLRPDDAEAAVRDASVVLVQLEIEPGTAEAALAAARRSGARAILNAAPAEGVTDVLLALTDILIVNETEAAALGGVVHLLTTGPEVVVITLGSRGAQWMDRSGGIISVPAFAVDAVDTTGAGDAFCGGLAAALSAGADAATALSQAAAAGAIVTTQVGAQTTRLSPDAVHELIVAGV